MPPRGEQCRRICPRGKDIGCFELFDTADSALAHSQQMHSSEMEDILPMQTKLVEEATVNEQNVSRPGPVNDFWSISEHDRNIFLEDDQDLTTCGKSHRHLRAHRIMTTDDGKDAPVPCSACEGNGVRCRLPAKGSRSDSACAFCDFKIRGCDAISKERGVSEERQILDTGQVSAFNVSPVLEAPSPDMSAIIRDIFEDDVTSAIGSRNTRTPFVTGDTMRSKGIESEPNDSDDYSKTAVQIHSGLENNTGPALRAQMSCIRTLTDKMDENERTGIQIREDIIKLGERVEANEVTLSEILKNHDTCFRALEEANRELQDRLKKQESVLAQKDSTIRESSNRLGEQERNTEKAIASAQAEIDSRFSALEHAHRDQMDELRTRQDNFSRESGFYFQELNQLLDEKERTITTAHASLDNDFDLRFRKLEQSCQDRMEQLEKRQEHNFAHWKQVSDLQEQRVTQSVAAFKAEYEMTFEKLAISTRGMREAAKQHEASAKEMKATISAYINTSYSPQATDDQCLSRIKELEDDNKQLKKENRKLTKRAARQQNKSVRKKDFDRLKAEVAEMKAAFAAHR